MVLHKPRPTTRKINRWSEKQDQMLLIGVLSSKADVDWDDVCKILDPDLTGAATVQHIAKLRKTFADEGLAVPPLVKGSTPLKFGDKANAIATANKGLLKDNPKSKSRSKRKSREADSDTEFEPERGRKRRRGSTAHSKSKLDSDGSYNDDIEESDDNEKMTSKKARHRGDYSSDDNESISEFAHELKSDAKGVPLPEKYTVTLTGPRKIMQYITPKLEYTAKNASRSNPLGKSLIVKLGVSATGPNFGVKEDKKVDKKKDDEEDKIEEPTLETPHLIRSASTPSLESFDFDAVPTSDGLLMEKSSGKNDHASNGFSMDNDPASGQQYVNTKLSQVVTVTDQPPHGLPATSSYFTQAYGNPPLGSVNSQLVNPTLATISGFDIPDVNASSGPANNGSMYDQIGFTDGTIDAGAGLNGYAANNATSAGQHDHPFGFPHAEFMEGVDLSGLDDILGPAFNGLEYNGFDMNSNGFNTFDNSDLVEFGLNTSGTFHSNNAAQLGLNSSLFGESEREEPQLFSDALFDEFFNLDVTNAPNEDET